MSKINYESVIIITPVLSEKMLQEATDTYKKLITGNGGELIHEENWGLTKMAYPIQKKSTGFYHIFEFTGDADIVDKLELAYRRDEQVLRYLTTRLDKHAILYNERRRNGAFNKPKEVAKETEAPAPKTSKPIKAETFKEAAKEEAAAKEEVVAAVEEAPKVEPVVEEVVAEAAAPAAEEVADATPEAPAEDATPTDKA